MTKPEMKKGTKQQLMAKAILFILQEMKVSFDQSKCEKAFVESLVSGKGHRKDKALFGNAVQHLKKNGAIKVDRRTGDLELSRKAFNGFPVGKGRTNDEMHSLIFGILVKQVDNLYTLSELWTKLSDGSAHSKEDLGNSDLCQHLEATSLRQATTALKRLGLIENIGSNAIRLTDKAFPEGRPINTEEPKYDIGTTFQKSFQGYEGLFQGTITEYDEESRLYHILYEEDEDEEDLTEGEVAEWINKNREMKEGGGGVNTSTNTTNTMTAASKGPSIQKISCWVVLQNVNKH